MALCVERFTSFTLGGLSCSCSTIIVDIGTCVNIAPFVVLINWTLCMELVETGVAPVYTTAGLNIIDLPLLSTTLLTAVVLVNSLLLCTTIGLVSITSVNFCAGWKLLDSTLLKTIWIGKTVCWDCIGEAVVTNELLDIGLLAIW